MQRSDFSYSCISIFISFWFFFIAASILFSFLHVFPFVFLHIYRASLSINSVSIDGSDIDPVSHYDILGDFKFR